MRLFLRSAVPMTLSAALTVSLLSACSPARLVNAVNATNAPRGLQVSLNQRYGPDARNVLDVYAPRDARNAPLVLFIHGGSWTGGDKSEHAFVGDSLARAGYVVGVMNYRLAPRNRYPAYVQDAALALKWLREKAAEYGAEARNVFVMGHSAGAFNAAELVDNQRWLREVNVPVGSIRGVIGLAGPYSYDFRDYPSRNAFPERGRPEDIMPDRHVRPDAPPHLLLVAANDTVVHPQNALNMEAALKKAGVSVERRVLPRLNHITIVGALARNLTFLGGTRSEVIRFIEANRLK